MRAISPRFDTPLTWKSPARLMELGPAVPGGLTLTLAMTRLVVGSSRARSRSDGSRPTPIRRRPPLLRKHTEEGRRGHRPDRLPSDLIFGGRRGRPRDHPSDRPVPADGRCPSRAWTVSRRARRSTRQAGDPALRRAPAAASSPNWWSASPAPLATLPGQRRGSAADHRLRWLGRKQDPIQFRLVSLADPQEQPLKRPAVCNREC
jgi:hypothetical protein